ncbi:PPM-type phosphatase domain [Trypanosoma melophagium]|uniref:PPM-type phosphatase domain n=1 Tax=Trypanosoma melophagium TaxID=715481 RepID=UPI00351A396D|nr:PPM-type phosphatase domain [Trypanosoma melophagium]
MAGGRVFRPLPPRPFEARKVVLIRSSLLFTVSMFFCYWVGTNVGIITAMLVLVFLWLGGALSLLDHLFRFVTVTGEEADFRDMLRRADIMQQPNIQKVSDRGENNWLSYGFSCMQGWRRTMEDDHVTILNEDGGFFGVFDGHSGANVARFCGDNIFEFVKKTAAFEDKNYTKALYDGFIDIDKHLYANYGNEKSGCTAVVLFVKEDELYCGNAGDSRSILCRDGEPVALSNDHKPFLPSEQSRIERAGGYVWNRRVNGALALSRAIGDFGFKSNTQVSWDQQAVTSAPEVRFSRLNRDRDEFAVIACDGIWDVLSNEQVVEFVRLRIKRRVPLDVIAEELIERCLSPHPFGIGCDNMSVVIVQFKRNKSPPSAMKLKEDSEVITAETNSSVNNKQSSSSITSDVNKNKESNNADSGAHASRESSLVKEKQQNDASQLPHLLIITSSEVELPSQSSNNRNDPYLEELFADGKTKRE